MEAMRALEQEYANGLHIVDGLLEIGEANQAKSDVPNYPARPGRSAQAARKDCAAGAGSPAAGQYHGCRRIGRDAKSRPERPQVD